MAADEVEGERVFQPQKLHCLVDRDSIVGSFAIVPTRITSLSVCCWAGMVNRRVSCFSQCYHQQKRTEVLLHCHLFSGWIAIELLQIQPTPTPTGFSAWMLCLSSGCIILLRFRGICHLRTSHLTELPFCRIRCDTYEFCFAAGTSTGMAIWLLWILVGRWRRRARTIINDKRPLSTVNNWRFTRHHIRRPLPCPITATWCSTSSPPLLAHVLKVADALAAAARGHQTSQWSVLAMPFIVITGSWKSLSNHLPWHGCGGSTALELYTI